MSLRNGAPAAFLLVVANILLPIAILTFATGFFPYKPFLPGLAEYDQDLRPGRQPPDAPFDRLVFMVVDALRSDFVYTEHSGFQFTQQLIAQGSALPFTAHATSPTVTMPRLKAITSGSTPSFLDAILNIDEADSSSSMAAQDTWLAQMKDKKPGKLVMHGDDTWLKLFPGTFDRVDGTTSFFVSDFTEVDNNVTRHVPEELQNDDWNTMVLHYLGLDHIGHKTGPRGPNMIPKQREMDGIVRQIYERMENNPKLESTLLVLIGDHGMNDAGNHGASSAGETSAALVFVSPKFKDIAKPVTVPAETVDNFRYYSFVQQSDVAPTLAALLGFPIPKNSLGVFIKDILPMWPLGEDRVDILLRNGRQMYDILAASFDIPAATEEFGEELCRPEATDAELLACRWNSIQDGVKSAYSSTSIDPAWYAETVTWLHHAQDLMTTMASNYDVPRLNLGTGIAGVATVLALISVILTGGTSLKSETPFALITILYGVMMFASSYVEEEQHFWYWATSLWVFYLTLKKSKRVGHSSMRATFMTMAVGFVFLRILRSWNQTGQKFAGEPDIVTIWLLPHPSLLWTLVLWAYVQVTWKLYNEIPEISSVISGSLVTALTMSAVSFKLAFTSEDAPELMTGFAGKLANLFSGPTLVELARAAFMGLGLASLYPLYILIRRPAGSSPLSAVRIIHALYTLLAMTQSRTTNLPLFLIYNTISSRLRSLDLNTTEATTTSLLMQFTSFFAMAGNNAISGIDLSSAYNGVSGFDIGIISLLTFLSNWAAPIWWCIEGVLLVLECRERAKAKPQSSNDATAVETKNKVTTDGEALPVRPWQTYIGLLTLFTATSLVFVMSACMALRTHLFIWTVFSPKYLYSMAWSLGQHLGVNVVVCSGLYWLAQ